MVYWWGPRALVGIYLNALLCAPLWGLPWKWSFLYALPETIEVGLSWLLFVKVARRSVWLPDLINTAQFLLFGSVLPAALANLYLVIQLIVLGDIARSTLWDNWIVLFSADVATIFVLAVPALIWFTKPMVEKGWAKTDGEAIRLPLLPDNRNSRGEVIFIAVVFISIFFMVMLTSINDYWIVYGVLMVILAIRYGVNIAVIASSWTGALALLLPPIMKNQLGLPTAAYSDVLIFNLDILFLCAVSLLIGRAISDLFDEIAERKRTQEILQKSEERFSKAFHDSPAGLTITSLADGMFIEVNESYLSMFEYRRAEVIGHTSIELNMLTAEERAKPVQQLREQGRVTNFELQMRAKSGRPLNVLFSTAQIELNGMTCALATIIDITERKRAEEKLRASEERLEILHEIDRALLSSSSPREIAKDALMRIRQLIPCPRASVSLFDLSRNEATFLDADFDGKGIVAETPITIQEFGQRVVDKLQQNEPWFVNDVVMDPQATELDKRLAKESGIHTWLSVPLFYQGQLIGALNLGRGPAEPFTAEDAETAQDVANQLAIAIQQARLYDALQKELIERKQAEEQIKRQIEHLKALRTIDMTIASGLNLHLTLQTILKLTVAQLHVDAADILLLNPTLHTLEYAEGIGFQTRGIERSSIRLGEEYAGKAALERKTISIDDLQKDREGSISKSRLTGERFVCYRGTPLIVKGEVRGVLEVFHRQPLKPDQDWMNFFETLSGQTGLAIDNATLFQNLQQSNLELIIAYETTLEGWSAALDLRDKETEGHTRRVTNLTMQLAKAMNMSDKELLQIRRGALLHDIGKMGVPDRILLKPGKLTDEEWEHMRQHPVFAYELLARIPYLRSALDIPYCHHEKWDGTGYPRGLKGEEIPLSARLFAVVDVYDALTSDRPYRKGWPHPKVMAYIREQAGLHFDPQVVEIFVHLIESRDEV